MDGADIVAEFQWLAMPAIAVVAVIAAIYFGIQNLRNIVTQRERDSAYASGRIEAKLENLEQLLRGVNQRLDAHSEKLDLHNSKLDAHDVMLQELRREAKKQSRRLRKLDKRVAALESSPTQPPTDPPLKLAAGRNSTFGRDGRAT